MGFLRVIQKKIYGIIKHSRRAAVLKLLDNKSKSLLDIGCESDFYSEKMKKKYKVTLADFSPKDKSIQKQDVQALSYKNKEFDIVLCQQVLEHVPNPVKAMEELKRVAKKQLIISVPSEPVFTMFRMFIWEKEHLWAITPSALKTHLGEPSIEKKIFFGRYYVAVWNL